MEGRADYSLAELTRLAQASALSAAALAGAWLHTATTAVGGVFLVAAIDTLRRVHTATQIVLLSRESGSPTSSSREDRELRIRLAARPFSASATQVSVVGVSTIVCVGLIRRTAYLAGRSSPAHEALSDPFGFFFRKTTQG